MQILVILCKGLEQSPILASDKSCSHSPPDTAGQLMVPSSVQRPRETGGSKVPAEDGTQWGALRTKTLLGCRVTPNTDEMPSMKVKTVNS